MMTAITVATETYAGKQEGGGGEGKAGARKGDKQITVRM